MTQFCLRLAFPALVLLLWGAAQQQAVRTPRTLVPSDMQEASILLPFAYQANPKCDPSGNVYFHLAGHKGPLATILRLSPDGKEEKLFSLPEENAKKGYVSFTDYSVSPDGKVFMLVGIGQQMYVVRFDSEGDLDKAIPIDILKEGLGIFNIAGFNSGTALLFGSYHSRVPADLRGKGYVATLDRADHLSVMPPPSLSSLDPGDIMQHEGVSAEDGNAYFIAGDEILAISETGDIVRRIRLEKPDPKAAATSVRVSGNWALVDLATPVNSEAKPDEPGTQVFYRFLLLDAQTGETLGFYELPKELSGRSEVCFSQKEGLKFIRWENRKMKFFKASL